MIIKTRPLFTAAAVALVSMTLVADVANAQNRQRRPAAKQAQSIDRSNRNVDRRQNVRQDHRADKRRQDVRQDRRSDNRKDVRHDNRRNDRFDDRREWREGRYNDFRRDYWRRRIVRRLITLPLHHAIVHHNSYTYYVVEGEYYTLENGVYISVEPSIGVIITTLPSAHQSLMVSGVPHYYHAGVYYRRHARGYISVRL